MVRLNGNAYLTVGVTSKAVQPKKKVRTGRRLKKERNKNNNMELIKIKGVSKGLN